jgi:3-methyladenine DNA glycosylase Tag
LNWSIRRRQAATESLEITAADSRHDRRVQQIQPRSQQRGFKFVGTTVIYAHMQALGMVNDHLVDCFRYRTIKRALS